MKFLDNDGLEYMVGKIAGLVGGSGSADFIVEQGTSGYWTYRKWASGLVEMWGSKSFTLNITTSWGNGFYYSGGSDSNYILLSYPSGMFIQTPTCFCQVSSSGASVMVMPTGLNSGGTSSTPAYHAVRSGSFSNCAVQAEFYVKGFWKTFTPGVAHSDPSADYIFERGTSGIWVYQKWNSGLAECWGVWGGQLTHYSTPTTGLYGYYVQMGLPAIFDSSVLPVIQVTAGVGNGFAWSGASMPASYTGTSFNAYAVSTLSGTNTVTFNMSIKGRWKPW